MEAPSKQPRRESVASIRGRPRRFAREAPGRRSAAERAGFTVLELVISFAILALVLVNVSTIVRSTSDVYQSGALLGRLEDQAQQAMDRIVYALMSTRGDDIAVPFAPLSNSSIEYELLLGVEDGVDVWGNPCRIDLVVQDGQVVWTQRPREEDEQRVVWTNWVPEFLQDEVPNGVDDNGNELSDEAGLAFNLDGRQIVVRLTLSRQDTDRTIYTRTLESRVTCRN